jgi:hypothetical protein
LVLIEFLPFTATKSHSNEMTASDSALPREEPPMFRFSIRDVLWLTVVVALGCAWWIEHQRTSMLARRLSEVDARRNVLQVVFDSMKAAAAKARMDEQFRRAYDSPRPR